MIPSDFFQVLPALCREDERYQALLRECQGQEALALPILERLSPEDRETIERYITLWEDLEYHQTRLAACHYAAHGAKEWVNEEFA